MLRFINVPVEFTILLAIISIHPMLRFIAAGMAVKAVTARFQYILCYGSSATGATKVAVTSRFQYILCYGSSTAAAAFFTALAAFQYILCYGSSINGA